MVVDVSEVEVMVMTGALVSVAFAGLTNNVVEAINVATSRIKRRQRFIRSPLRALVEPLATN
jgi:hypothetical protein